MPPEHSPVQPPPAGTRIVYEPDPAKGHIRITIPPPSPCLLDALEKIFIHIAVLMALGIFYWFISTLVHAPRVDGIAVFLATVFLLGPVVYGLIFASAFAWRQYQPALPEILVLDKSRLTWDPGTSYIRSTNYFRSKLNWGDFFPKEMWTTIYPKRVVQEFDAAQLQTLCLRDMASGGRLTIDKDGRRWDIAYPASLAERRWLFATLGDFYRLSPAGESAACECAAPPSSKAHSGIIVETVSGNTQITIPYPPQGYRDIIFRIGMVLSAPAYIAWVYNDFWGLFGLPLWFLPIKIPLFLVLLIGGIFVFYKAYQYGGPRKPEIFLLTPSRLIYDSGTPYLWLMFDGEWYGWENLENFYYRRRRKAEFGPAELESLGVKETKTGNKLILMQGRTKFELGGAASEPERDWLCRVLREHYRIEGPDKAEELPAPPAKKMRPPKAAASH
jgi:hypothetical protein